jgi:hypothetical protein
VTAVEARALSILMMFEELANGARAQMLADLKIITDLFPAEPGQQISEWLPGLPESVRLRFIYLGGCLKLDQENREVERWRQYTVAHPVRAKILRLITMARWFYRLRKSDDGYWSIE